MELLGSHATYFYEIWYLRSFRKSVHKIQVSLKYDKSNVYFTCGLMQIFLPYLNEFIFEWENLQVKL